MALRFDDWTNWVAAFLDRPTQVASSMVSVMMSLNNSSIEDSCASMYTACVYAVRNFMEYHMYYFLGSK